MAYGARLESGLGETPHGFKSHILRPHRTGRALAADAAPGPCGVRPGCGDDGQVPLEHLRGDRRRATGFGSIALDYDRYRSGYPDALLEELMRPHPSTVLDVGCGTGKVAAALARRGAAVLGVDPDPRMAAVARNRGVPTEIAAFEEWDDSGRRFDLVTCGHAWHWVRPDVGIDKVADVLVAGGTFARFWNYHAVEPALLAEFEASYREHAPGVPVIGRDVSGTDDAPDPLEHHSAFRNLRRRTYRWNRMMSADEWTGLIATFGDHRRLGSDALRALQHALARVIDAQDGPLRVRGGTYAVLAERRADATSR